MEDITKYFIRPVENWDRVNTELKVIQNNKQGIDLASYFIVLADIINNARKNGIIIGPGRGSAAGCYIAYLMGILDINPIKHNLPFARFLSEARINKGSLPDIDSDVPTSKREEVLQYAYNKYGDKCAHVCTFAYLKLKNSLLDVYRAMVTQPMELEIDNAKRSGDLQLNAALASKLRKQTDEFELMRKSLETIVPGVNDQELIHGYKDSEGILHPGLLESNNLFASWTKKYPELFEITEKILGLPRHIGVHAGGLIIAPVSLPEIVPVMQVDGVPVVVYDKKVIQKQGLIKFDILGITTLDLIQGCLDELKNRNINLDIYNLPDNPDMWDIFLDGKCHTIFQWNKSSAARFAQKLKPRSFKDLADGVALNRPGALDAIMTLSDGTKMTAADVYLGRKSGELPIEYLHPSLEPILKDTLGVAFLQELIMKIMTDLFGYSEEQADDVRSQISDKNVKAFEQIKKDAQSLLAKGWKQDQIDELYNQILAFSRYGFNSAHSVSYATLSYITAWLKYHYPLEWWRSVLTHSKEEDVLKYWTSVYQFIGSPDVNELSDQYKIKNNKLVPPISSIKGIGDAVLNEINKNGPYTSLEDFFNKTSRRIINVGVVQKLAISGAFDSLINREFYNPESKLRYVFAILKKNDKENFPEKFQNLTPYEWYLELKRILPASAASLYGSIKKTPSVKMPFITKDLGENVSAQALRGKYVLVNGKGLNSIIEEMSLVGRGYVEVCAYGYVKSLRRFSYKNNSRSAIEVNIDFDFLPYSGVIWAPYEESEPECNSYLLDKECYLFNLKVTGTEGKEIQITKVTKILMEKKDDKQL